MNPEVLPDGNQLKCQFRRKLVEKTGSVHKLAKKTRPIFSQYRPQATTQAKSPWDTRKKHAQNWTFAKHVLRKCVALFILHYFGHCPPLPSPSNVESARNDFGCEGRFKATLHSGCRGNARIYGVFAKVSQDFWPGLSEVAKLEYILPILEEITLRRIIKSSVLPLAVRDCTNLRCFCESVQRLLARIVVQ